jgi:N utilization substance protein B
MDLFLEDITMTRSNAREIAIQMVFSLSFGNVSADEVLESQLTQERFQELAEEIPLYEKFPEEKQQAYIRQLVRGAFDHGPELDDYISRYAKGWAFSRIPRMAAAIMRTAMYEVLYMPDVPNAAAINEAVEIAKKYEPQEVVSFLNGILGSFVRAEFADTPPKPEKAEQVSDQPQTDEKAAE